MQGRELPPGKVAYETPWPLGSLQKINGERYRYRAGFSWASTKREPLLHQTFELEDMASGVGLAPTTLTTDSGR